MVSSSAIVPVESNRSGRRESRRPSRRIRCNDVDLVAAASRATSMPRSSSVDVSSRSRGLRPPGLVGDASAVLIKRSSLRRASGNHASSTRSPRHRADAVALQDDACHTATGSTTGWARDPPPPQGSPRRTVRKRSGAKLAALMQGRKTPRPSVEPSPLHSASRVSPGHSEEIHGRFDDSSRPSPPPDSVIAVFEDMQWAEPALLDLVEHLVAWSMALHRRGARRGRATGRRPNWGAASSRAATSGWRSARTTSIGSSGTCWARRTCQSEARAVVAAAEGQPLFVEQLVGMLTEDGHLVREGDRWRTTGCPSRPGPRDDRRHPRRPGDHSRRRRPTSCVRVMEGRAFHLGERHGDVAPPSRTRSTSDGTC